MYASNHLVRHATPPSYHQPAFFPESVDSHFSNHTLYSSNSGSPESVLTTNTSPQRSSPGSATIKAGGPVLLPRIRCQDQTSEPTASIHTINHGRALSMAVPTIHTAFSYPEAFRRRGTSPLDGVDLHSPASACSLPASIFSNMSAVSSAVTDCTTTSSLHHRYGTSPSPLNTNVNSPITTNLELNLNPNSRRSSLATSMVRAASGPVTSQQHSRNVSSSSVDEAALLKHGYPTQYRGMPQYITSAPTMAPLTAVAMPVQPMQPMQHHFDVFSPVVSPVYINTEMPTNSLMQPPLQTTNIISYLSQPGPSPSLITRSATDQLKHRDFGWWDVRNLRSWSEFNINTIMSIPGFGELLTVPIDVRSLPHPSINNVAPETEYALRNVFHDYYSQRINSALEQTQGSHHLFMRAGSASSLQHCPRPDFISTYEHDIHKTLRGESRGHLVGIVKSYEDWNTAMRSQSPPQQVKYLKGLAQLQRIMREHGCRYGYIMTEIELLCVKAGAEDEDYARPRQNGALPHLGEGPRPVFGALHTSMPIPLSTSGPHPETGAPQMTASLALWYMHMLAKDEPLPGQAIWKMDVGGPAAVSRHNHRTRDTWMPRIGVQESRVVKRLRGWVHPDEPFNRKEAPKSKRRGHA